MNSIYVLEIVLAILLSEMRPMPEIRPKNSAITNEIIVDKNVIESPGRIKLNALLYSGFENMTYIIHAIIPINIKSHQLSGLNKFLTFMLFSNNKAIGTVFRAYCKLIYK